MPRLGLVKPKRFFALTLVIVSFCVPLMLEQPESATRAYSTT